MNMSDQDKETIELMIENKLNEKLNPIDRKLDKVLDKMDRFSEWQEKTDGKVEELAEQTSVWRWLQRKPKRFAIVLGVMWLISIYEIRTSLIDFIKGTAEFLNIL